MSIAAGYEALAPTGLILPVGVLLLVTGWIGWEMAYRSRIAVAD